MVRGTSRRGVAKVEYALLLTLISVSCVLVVGAFGENTSGLFDIGDAAPVVPTPTAGTPPGPGGQGKHGKHDKDKDDKHRGNPGQGNNGNGKDVGNGASDKGKKP